MEHGLVEGRKRICKRKEQTPQSQQQAVCEVASKVPETVSNREVVDCTLSTPKRQHDPNTTAKWDFQSPGWPQLEDELTSWMHQASDKQIELSWSAIRNCSLELAQQMGCKDFTATQGWYHKFQRRFKKKGRPDSNDTGRQTDNSTDAASSACKETPKRALIEDIVKEAEGTVADSDEELTIISPSGLKRRRESVQISIEDDEDEEWTPKSPEPLTSSPPAKAPPAKRRMKKKGVESDEEEMYQVRQTGRPEKRGARSKRRKVKESSSVQPSEETPGPRWTSGRERREPDKYIDQPRQAYVEKENVAQAEKQAQILALYASIAPENGKPQGSSRAGPTTAVSKAPDAAKTTEIANVAGELGDQRIKYQYLVHDAPETVSQASLSGRGKGGRSGRGRGKGRGHGRGRRLSPPPPASPRIECAQSPEPPPQHTEALEVATAAQTKAVNGFKSTADSGHTTAAKASAVASSPLQQPAKHRQVVRSSHSVPRSKGKPGKQDSSQKADKQRLKAKDRKAASLSQNKQMSKAVRDKRNHEEISDSGTDNPYQPHKKPYKIPSHRAVREESRASHAASSLKEMSVSQPAVDFLPTPNGTECRTEAAPTAIAPQSNGPNDVAPQSKSPSDVVPVSNVPNVDGPQSNGPNDVAPQSNGPSDVAPLSNGPKAVAPQSKGPQAAAPVSNGPKAVAPVSNGPKAAARASNGPKTVAPVSNSHKVEAPVSNGQKASIPKSNGILPGPPPDTRADKVLAMQASGTGESFVQQIGLGPLGTLTQDKASSRSQVAQNLHQLLQGKFMPSVDALEHAFTREQLDLDSQCRKRIKSCHRLKTEIDKRRAAAKEGAAPAAADRKQAHEKKMAEQATRLEEVKTQRDAYLAEVKRLQDIKKQLIERKQHLLADSDQAYFDKLAPMMTRAKDLKKRKLKEISNKLEQVGNGGAPQVPSSGPHSNAQAAPVVEAPELIRTSPLPNGNGLVQDEGDQTEDHSLTQWTNKRQRTSGKAATSKPREGEAHDADVVEGHVEVPSRPRTDLRNGVGDDDVHINWGPLLSQLCMSQNAQACTLQNSSQAAPLDGQSSPRAAPPGAPGASPWAAQAASPSMKFGTPPPKRLSARAIQKLSAIQGLQRSQQRAQRTPQIPAGGASQDGLSMGLAGFSMASPPPQRPAVESSRPMEPEPRQPEFTEADLPALWTHINAFEAHAKVTQEYFKRRREAEEYTGNRAIKGRILHGYTSRCGGLFDPNTNMVTIGCGTSLADVHYTCYSCSEEHDGATKHSREAASPMSASCEMDASLDYCGNCLKQAGYRCPNENCISRKHGFETKLVAHDYLQDAKGVRSFASESEEAAMDWNGKDIATFQAASLKDSIKSLPKSCQKAMTAPSPMVVVDVETNEKHQAYKNGLADGVPVLITGAAPHFDPEPFSAESMFQLAQESTATQDLKVKDQFGGEDGGTSVSVKCTLQDFFAPMLKKTNMSRLQSDVKGQANHTGFKLPDFGLQPEAQTKAFWEGMASMGLHDICRGDSPHNIATALRSEKRDPINGTAVPDLGPKFYIARPLMTKKKGVEVSFSGFTFTPLHCDLADAVNYSCWGASATWHIFHRQDRPKLLQFLKEYHGSLHCADHPEAQPRSGEDMLWNASNHILLQPADFEVLKKQYGVKPWKFTQKAGEIVVIPAGCAHQVKNDGLGPNCKIAQDFIAPQSALVCLELMDEMRQARQEDKLQAVLSLRFAGADAFRKRYLGEAILERPPPPTC